MYSNLKKGLFLVTFSGAAMLLPVTAKAADTQSELPSVGIEEVLDHCYSSGKEIEIEKYLVPTKKGEYLDMAFADVETFLYIRSEPTTESEWVGKLYPDDAAKIMGPVDEWTKVQSGSVTGYVYSKYITVGKKAEEKAQKIVKKKQEKRLEKKKIEKENPEKEEVLEKPEQIFEYAESKEEEEANLAAGKPYVIRQNNPTEGTTTFHDDIYGDITVDNAELDDMILIKSDGYPTYNFANVVDDHLMGITHVVRGNEYLSSSPKYNRLYDAFGWKVPEYVHCPLITDEEHQKLSKRCGHSSYEDLIEQGFLSEAIVNFVALLGWSPEDNREIFTLEELVGKFDYHHLSKSPAVFDYTKLKWMNGEYMKAMDFEVFYEMAEPYLKEAVTKDLDFKKIAAMVKTRIEIFPDIKEHVDFFEELPEYDVAMYTHKKMKTNAETSLEVLKEVLPLLEEQEDYSNDALYAVLSSYVEQKGCKNGYVMWPVRTAVSGKQMTPGGATELMEILGKEESLARIRKGIEKLTSTCDSMHT